MNRFNETVPSHFPAAMSRCTLLRDNSFTFPCRHVSLHASTRQFLRISLPFCLVAPFYETIPSSFTAVLSRCTLLRDNSFTFPCRHVSLHPSTRQFLRVSLPFCLVARFYETIPSHFPAAMSRCALLRDNSFGFPYRNVSLHASTRQFFHISLPPCLVAPFYETILSHFPAVLSRYALLRDNSFTFPYRNVSLRPSTRQFFHISLPQCLVAPFYETVPSHFIPQCLVARFYETILSHFHAAISRCALLRDNSFDFPCRHVSLRASTRQFFHISMPQCLVARFYETILSNFPAAMSRCALLRDNSFAFPCRNVSLRGSTRQFLRISIPPYLVARFYETVPSHFHTAMSRCALLRDSSFAFPCRHVSLHASTRQFLRISIPQCLVARFYETVPSHFHTAMSRCPLLRDSSFAFPCRNVSLPASTRQFLRISMPPCLVARFYETILSHFHTAAMSRCPLLRDNPFKIPCRHVSLPASTRQSFQNSPPPCLVTRFYETVPSHFPAAMSRYALLRDSSFKFPYCNVSLAVPTHTSTESPNRLIPHSVIMATELMTLR